MRPSAIVLSGLLLASAPVAVASPSRSAARTLHPPAPQYAPDHSHLPAWRRLSDAIIRRIWKVPCQDHLRVIQASKSPSEAAWPSKKLLATYGNDVVLRFTITTEAEASALAEAANVLILDVWEFNDNWVDIRLGKDVVPFLLGLLPESMKTSYATLMRDHDLAQAIFDSFPSPTRPSEEQRSYTMFAPAKPVAPVSRENIFFNDYQPLSVILPWMRLMASMFPTHTRFTTIGLSYEGRDIPALRVGVRPKNNQKPNGPRKTILVTGGTHAREWISVSTVNYVAWYLITNYGKSHQTTSLLESFDFVFIPTLNPDGYVHTWTEDRLWRKNRQPTSLRFCRGVDLDRSFSYKWDGESTGGNPCSESFSGDGPFEATESRRLAEWARNETEQNNARFVSFIDLHSYSQQVLYPYSYSCSAEPPTLENLEEVALGLAKAMRLAHNGHIDYKTAPACEGNVGFAQEDATGKTKRKSVLPLIESGGGSALDWFYHALGVHYSYQIKLRDTGSYGFLLPKENIIPTGKEVVSAVEYLGKFLLGQVGMQEDKPSNAIVKITPVKDEDETPKGKDIAASLPPAQHSLSIQTPIKSQDRRDQILDLKR